MSLSAEVRDRGEKIAKTLDKAGLVVDPYRRAPITAELFTLNLNPDNILRVWPAGEVDLSTDRRHRQAVITATEKRRKITRRYTLELWPADSGGDDKRIRQIAVQHFPITVPGGTVRPGDVRLLSTVPSKPGLSRYDTHEVEATMLAPAMHQSFLMGFDETSQFIAMLPETCDTVTEAHEVLRPRRVKPGTLRQGEFFFVPITKKERALLDKKATNPDVRPLEGWYQPWDYRSTHHALTHLIGGTIYATGMAWDTRKGRHDPLHLDDWYRVVRNREIVQRNPAARHWD